MKSTEDYKFELESLVAARESIYEFRAVEPFASDILRINERIVEINKILRERNENDS